MNNFRSKGVSEKRFVEFRKMGMREPVRDKNGKLTDGGGFEAYGNVKGYLDTHGTIMWHGCYVKHLDAFIKNGFVPDTHGASANYTTTNSTILAYINDAKEDNYGLLVDATFHTTQVAQDTRTMYMERLEAGKTCGNSIGFAIRDFFTIMPKDYATEIPKYSLPEFVQQNLERAQQMYCVDICTEIEVFESSLTLIPSNEVSLVEEMRGRGKGKSKTLVTPSGDLFFRTKAFKDFSNDFDGMLKRIEAMEIAERSALAAEIPTLNSPFIKDIIIMATETRKKPDEDDDDSKLDMDSVKDCRDDVKRALTKLAKHHEDMGEMHRDLMEKHEDGAKLHRDAKKALDKLSKTLDAKKPDDGDSDEDKKDKRAREIAARYSN